MHKEADLIQKELKNRKAQLHLIKGSCCSINNRYFLLFWWVDRMCIPFYLEGFKKGKRV